MDFDMIDDGTTSVNLTKPQLQKALEEWEQASRDNDKDRDVSEPVEALAARNTEYLWNRFNQCL